MITPRAMPISVLVRWSVPTLLTRTFAIPAAVSEAVIWGSSSVVTEAFLTELLSTTVAFMRLAIAYLALRPLVA